MAVHIRLVKDDTQQWTVDVRGCDATYTWGKVGGKLQEQTDAYTEGKQKRTAEQQARFEALSAVTKKIRGGYVVAEHAGLTAAELAALRGKEADVVSPAPMLALEYDGKRKAKVLAGGTKYVQKKLDGRRCLANLDTGALYSRGRKPMTGLDHIAAAVRALRPRFPPSVVWLDGEVYKHGLGFQTVTSLATGATHTSKGDAAVLQYCVYDVVADRPFAARLQLLQDASLPVDDESTEAPVVLVRTDAVTSADGADLDRLHADYVARGYEGTIIRLDGTFYEEDKRSASLLKRKDWQQEEFTVVGFVKEAHADTLGSVSLSDAQGNIFSATPSMSDADKLAIWQNQSVYAMQHATVKFFEKYESGAPRFPVLVGFRDAADLVPPAPPTAPTAAPRRAPAARAPAPAAAGAGEGAGDASDAVSEHATPRPVKVKRTKRARSPLPAPTPAPTPAVQSAAQPKASKTRGGGGGGGSKTKAPVDPAPVPVPAPVLAPEPAAPAPEPAKKRRKANVTAQQFAEPV